MKKERAKLSKPLRGIGWLHRGYAFLSRYFYSLYERIKHVFRPVPPSSITYLDATGTGIEDWNQASRLLQSIVHWMQSEISSIEVHRLNFTLLGLSSYLMRIEISLSQNIKYYDIYEKRARDLNPNEKKKHSEFLKATKACQDIYQTVKICTELLQGINLKNFKNNNKNNNIESLCEQVSLLEQQTQNLAVAIQNLNERLLNRGPLYFILDSDLFKIMHLFDYSGGMSGLTSQPNLLLKESSHHKIVVLQQEAEKIQHKDLRFIAHILIQNYEDLSKYLIFMSSEVLQDTFNVFYKQINKFIQETMTIKEPLPDKKETIRLYRILNKIFRKIESIRFITNKKDSFAKKLQEATRTSAKQLRKNLGKTAIGQDFLNRYYRMNMKEKMRMRNRFKP